MNLLIFIYSLSSGGAERVTANLANHWANKGWRVTVVTLASQDHDFYWLNPVVRRIALNLADDSPNPILGVVNNLLRVLALRRVLKEVQPDVALAMMTIANILLALAALRMRKMVCIGSERTYPPRLRLGALWENLRTRMYGQLSALVVLTQESAVWLREFTYARQIRVIPNPVSWPLVDQEPKREWPKVLEGRQVLLAVGRLSPEKQLNLLLCVFMRLAREFPDWMLVILGEGPERMALEFQIRSRGLQDRVLMPGRTGNVGLWYERADLYVMTSRFEGFPNTLAEALAYGVPSISFDCETGPRDIIRHEVDGLLVPADDETSLENALRNLMADKFRRKRLAKRAVEVRDRLAIEKIANLWEMLFEEVRI